MSSPPPPTTTCIHTDEGRSLILNIDGTANQFCEHSTNVVELFSRIIRDERQVAYYDSGIGTYARPSFRSLSYLKQVVYHAIDTAIAWKFENIVHAAYEWLSKNYQPGDRIFLFGFSRGAYHYRWNDRESGAYELYSSVMDASTRNSTSNPAMGSAANNLSGAPLAPPSPSKEDKLCAQFKRTLCHENVQVHFIGAWDTVSSIGIFRGKSLPETVSGMGHVCHFRHALALDECRVKFQPEYANGGLGPNQVAQRGDVKEVWFAGSHSDIGGGNILNEELANFGPSLRWVTYEAVTCGLRVKPYTGKWVSITPTNSLTWHWKLLEVLPFGSLSYTDENSTTWWPHLGGGRTIQPGQLIHQSVFSGIASSPVEHSTSDNCSSRSAIRLANGRLTPAAEVSEDPCEFPLADDLPDPQALEYIEQCPVPASLPHGSPSWFKLYENNLSNTVIERDPYEDANHTLQTLQEICDHKGTNPDFHKFDAALDALHPVLHDEARRAYFTEVFEAGTILVSALRFLQAHRPATTQSRSRILSLLKHARVGHRKHTTSQIREWLASSDMPPSELHYILRNFGDPLIDSRPSQHIGRQILTYTCIPGLFRERLSLQVPFMRSITAIHSWMHQSATDDDKTGFRKELDQMHEVSRFLCRLQRILPDGATHSGFDLPQSSLEELPSTADQSPALDCPRLIATPSPDGTQLACAIGPSSPIFIFNHNEQQTPVIKHISGVSSLTWSPTRQFLTCGTDSGHLMTWDITLDEPIHDVPTGIHRPIHCLAYRHDERLLATAASTRIHVWRCDTWEPIWEFDKYGTNQLAFSSDGKQLTTESELLGKDTWDVEFDDW
ncbi:hypothetical protein ONZ45_g6972 [Pleurotus djamor]|nr:hypothetical protein ONZ45_g6972 [Pleurotus djamor]